MASKKLLSSEVQQEQIFENKLKATWSKAADLPSWNTNENNNM